MTSSDIHPASRALTRRELRAKRRAQSASDHVTPAAVPMSTTSRDALPAPALVMSDAAHTPPRVPTASASVLGWVRPDRVAAEGPRTDTDSPAPSLLKGAPRRSPIRLVGLIPLVLVAAMGGAYATVMSTWPTHELPPVVTLAEVPTLAGEPMTMTWPDVGTAAVSVKDIGSAASSSEALPMASITKVISVLMVLDERPLSLGQHGTVHRITQQDVNDVQRFRNRNESSLSVPAGGSLTQYQLLQGTMVASAGNYLKILTRDIWGSDADFAAAAEIWLRERGLEGITVVEPTGIDPRNTATPDALVRLGELAMAHPVVREIAAQRVIEIPGAGRVSNTNPLLREGTVDGLKTGLLKGKWNLLSAKELTIDGTDVLVTAVVLSQESDEKRASETSALLTQVESALRVQHTATGAGVIAGEVSTAWGEKAPIVTDGETQLILWNTTTPSTHIQLDLGDKREAGDTVGTLTVVGPLDESATTLSLAGSIEGPDFWWRLTHPMQLLGLAD